MANEKAKIKYDTLSCTAGYRKKLRIITTVTGEGMAKAMDRLIETEYQKVKPRLP